MDIEYFVFPELSFEELLTEAEGVEDQMKAIDLGLA